MRIVKLTLSIQQKLNTNEVELMIIFDNLII